MGKKKHNLKKKITLISQEEQTKNGTQQFKQTKKSLSPPIPPSPPTLFPHELQLPPWRKRGEREREEREEREGGRWGRGRRGL